MGVAGAQTTRPRSGSCVTDLIRRHPAVLAQTSSPSTTSPRAGPSSASGRREQLNITPYGMPFDKPVARLVRGHRHHAAALGVRRQAGRLRRPVPPPRERRAGHGPVRRAAPPIWTAAHGPRMLRPHRAQGRRLAPDQDVARRSTAARWARSAQAASDAGRDPRRDHARAARLRPGGSRRGDRAAADRGPAGARAVRAAARRTSSAASASSRRCRPPAPRAFTTSSRRPSTARGVAADRRRDPARGRRHYAFCGTPEQVADQVAELRRGGPAPPVMWNITAFGDPSLARWSFGAMSELRKRLAA